MTEAKKQQLFTVLNTALQNKPTGKKSRTDENIEKFRLTKKYK